MVVATPPPTTSDTPPAPAPVPSKVFPLPGWTGPINTHWGQGITGGSDLMVSASGVQPVVSMVSGKVSYVGSQATAAHSGGNSVEITGLDGLEYYYAHLAAPLGLKVGDTVAAGQLLGMADSTGDAAGGPPHLHIGIGDHIILGTGAAGGTGANFDAVSLLRSLVKDPKANNPDIVSSSAQQSITTSQPAGTISLGPPTAQPLTMSLADRIKWLAQLLNAAGVPADKIPTLTAISLAENRSSDPNATSSTHDLGLWQINIPTWSQALINAGIISSVEDLKDPLKNAKAALFVLNQQGFTAWATFNAGLHNGFLPQVQAALSGVDLGSAGTPAVSGGSSADNPCNCGNWNLGPFKVPDLGCVFQCRVAEIINQWKTNWLAWWNKWKDEHVANWFFVGIGFVILVVGIGALIGVGPIKADMAQSQKISGMQSNLAAMEAVA